MKSYLFALLCLSTIIVNAQSRFSLGLEFYPNLSSVMIGSEFDSLDQIIDEYNDIKSFKPSYSAGLAVGFRLNESFGLHSGLQYVNSGYATEEIELIWIDPNDTLPITSKTTNIVRFIGVPLNLRYSSGQDESGFFIYAGAEFWFVLSETTDVKLKYEDGHVEHQKNDIEPDEEYSRPIIALSGGFGYQIPIGENLMISIAPSFQYCFQGIYDDSDIKISIYNAGLRFGIGLR